MVRSGRGWSLMALSGPTDDDKKGQLVEMKRAKGAGHFRSLQMTGLTVDVAGSSQVDPNRKSSSVDLSVQHVAAPHQLRWKAAQFGV